jgi:STAS-like domain of unknown function (DUF4325)
MSEFREISVASDFSPFPVGRIPEDGEYNGQAFRERLLTPALRDAIAKDGRVIVWLDGIKSCGSSFLESAFGGLIRENGFEKKQVKKYLEIKSNNKAHDRYLRAIERYIESASR